MSKRKDVIRKYDRVKITNPEVFVRCGYPLNKQKVIEQLTEEQKDAIKKMLAVFNINSGPMVNIFDKSNMFVTDVGYDYVWNKITDILAGQILRQKLWGGKERRIHTINRPELMYKDAQVTDRRLVKTGDYTPGYSRGGGYFDGDEYHYEPAYLTGEKTHTILKIRIGTPEHIFGEEIEIEKCNVVKYNEETKETYYEQKIW